MVIQIYPLSNEWILMWTELTFIEKDNFQISVLRKMKQN